MSQGRDGARDAEERAQLEQQRDFLLQSLDDLELEHDSGGIDDESYAELHDDYTARAAAVIRTLRDGIDTRPPVPTRSKRVLRMRIVTVSVIVVFAVVAGVSLAYALGARLPGQTASGNSGSTSESATAKAVGKDITRLQKAVDAKPDDYDLRLQLADAYARNNDLPTAMKQWDAAVTIDSNRPEGHANLGRALYLVSEQMTDKAAQREAVAEAVAAFDKAIAVGPDFADSYFYRAVVRAALQQYVGSQVDLQTYLLKAGPNGQWVDNARSLLAQVTTALEAPSTTVPSSTTRPKSK
jgi:cytochrome c-type biogenesis protein CcmH/NrfG